MDKIQIRLRIILFRLGVDPSHKGYKQLSDCVVEYIDATDKSMNAIYAAVSENYDAKPKSIMRNISYALRCVPDLRDRLSEMLGFSVNADTLHNGSVIAYIAELVSQPSLFDFSA